MIRKLSLCLLLGACCTIPACSSGKAQSSPPSGTTPMAARAVAGAYAPQFTAVKTENGHYWIEDHGQRVALLASGEISLFRQYPGQVLDEKKIIDPTGGMGFLRTPGLRLATSWISAKGMKGVPCEMKLDSSNPAQLTINLSWKKSAEEFGTQVLVVSYDRQLARYTVEVDDNLQIKEMGGGEYCNVYPLGVGDFRPDHNRYDRLLYTDGDDGSKLKAHYLSVIVPQPGPIHLPAASGLLAYANEKEGNPVIMLEESSPQTHNNVCLCWFDSHMTWDDAEAAGQKGIPVPQLSGPPYHYHARFKAYWDSAAEMQALLAKAQPVSLASYPGFKNSLPIDMNVVNDFEHFADVAAGKVKHIYFQLKAMRPNGGIVYDTAVGHSGHSSISMISKSEKGMDQVLFGPELMVTSGRQLKISAWVKTSNVTGQGFYLETGFLRGKEQVGPEYQSAKLTGTHDWTLLEIPLPVTPEKVGFLGNGRISFHLAGEGTVWVDDFVFAEQNVGAPPARDPKH